MHFYIKHPLKLFKSLKRNQLIKDSLIYQIQFAYWFWVFFIQYLLKAAYSVIFALLDSSIR